MKAATPAAKAATPAAKASDVKAGSKRPASSSSSSSSSSDSSDSSDSEDEKPPLKKPATTASKTPAKAPEASGVEHKIYVKGLPWSASEADVKEFFKACGKIVSAETPLGDDGRSTGTAFVKFSQRKELEAALELDGQTWPGTERWLKIVEGAEKSDRKSIGASGGVKPEGCDTVFVGNLPWDVEEGQLRDLFAAAGDVSSVRFATNEDGSFKGFGHVSFYNGDDTDAAVKLSGSDVNGRAIRVDYAPPRARSGGSPMAGGRGRGRDSGGRGGRGGGGGGRFGGRGGDAPINKNKGSIAPPSGKKMTFD